MAAFAKSWRRAYSVGAARRIAASDLAPGPATEAHVCPRPYIITLPLETLEFPVLSTQKDPSELLLIAKPILGLRNRRAERLRDGFLCDHPGSLDGRERNDGADCAHADECDSERNNQSNGELLAAGHGGPPSFEGPWVRHMRG
jgi:hypothetical protein